MRQLVQLQKKHDRIQELGGEVVAVFREESEGTEGLAKTQQKTDATFPLLLDLNAEATGRYSQDGFHTYFIDPKGVIRAILPGTKAERATAEKVVDQLEKLAGEDPDASY